MSLSQILLLLIERHSLCWWWWEGCFFFFSAPSMTLRRGRWPLFRVVGKQLRLEALSPGIPESTTGRTQRSCRKCVLRINGGVKCWARTFSFPHLRLGDLYFSFLEINVLYFFFFIFFFLKVHLLNPWWLSLQTIPYHVINPLGVSFRSNDILWFFFFKLKANRDPVCCWNSGLELLASRGPAFGCNRLCPFFPLNNI